MTLSTHFKIAIFVCGILTLTACGLAVPKGAYSPDPLSPQFQRLSQSLSQAALAVGENPENYKLGAIRTSEIQAANAGAGKFYFSDGLASKSREIIDGVVAHEVAHEVLGHVGQKVVTAMAVSTLFSIGGLIVPGLGYANYIVNPLVVRTFGRSQELEADQKAVEILGMMGYSQPEHVMLQVLTHYRDLYGSTGGGLLSSHPNIEERITEIAKLKPGVAQLEVSPVTRVRLRERPLGFGIERLYLDAKIEITTPEGDISKAIIMLENVERHDPLYRDSLTLLGRAYYKSQRYNIALQILNRALAVNREDEIAQIVYALAQLRLGDDEGGLRRLKDGLTLLRKSSKGGYRGYSNWDMNGLVESALLRAIQVASKGLIVKDQLIESSEILLQSVDDEDLSRQAQASS